VEVEPRAVERPLAAKAHLPGSHEAEKLKATSNIKTGEGHPPISAEGNSTFSSVAGREFVQRPKSTHSAVQSIYDYKRDADAGLLRPRGRDVSLYRTGYAQAEPSSYSSTNFRSTSAKPARMLTMSDISKNGAAPAVSSYQATFKGTTLQPEQRSVPSRLQSLRPRALLQASPDKSTAHRDFGPHGSNPRQYTATSPSQQSAKATTKELFAGTAKVTHAVAGYTGHVNADKLNPHVSKQAQREVPHVGMDQNICENFQKVVPGYTGYQPRSVANEHAGLTCGRDQRLDYGQSFRVPKLNAFPPVHADLKTNFGISRSEMTRFMDDLALTKTYLK
jgi:hypothetical protein